MHGICNQVNMVFVMSIMFVGEMQAGGKKQALGSIESQGLERSYLGWGVSSPGPTTSQRQPTPKIRIRMAYLSLRPAGGSGGEPPGGRAMGWSGLPWMIIGPWLGCSLPTPQPGASGL